MSQPSTEQNESSDNELSQADVARLLQNDSADARINVLDKIAKHYNEGEFQETEYVFAEQIFRLMMKDAEERVRHTLAEHVKNNPEIPRDVVLHLAKDVEEVALPILEASEVLNEADLIQIIESSREVSKLCAISDREDVSDRMSDALVESSQPEVVKTLLKNEKAKINENTFERIIDGFADNEDVTSAMATRSTLPVNVVEKLVNHVSGAIAEKLQQRYDIKSSGLQQQVHDSVTLDFLSYNQTDAEIEKVVNQMIHTKRLTPSIILSGLCRGYLHFFEISLARMADIPKVNARKLIHDKGPLGFKALYVKAHLPESMFEAIRIVLRVIKAMEEEETRPGTTQYANALVSQVLKAAEGKDIDNLPYVIALIRQAAGAN